MKIESTRLENNVQLIKLIGTLDVLGVNEVEKQFVALCAGEAVFVLVDLSQVNYLSSIGIPLLINSAKGVSARGGRLAFINPQVKVRAVLDLTGVLHSIRIYPDIKTGLVRIKLD